uniref:Uncharacterized protein n=1 Tax=Oryza meridionalis TaxID=40149 RepID=A0A0E0DS01_9ORYZ
MAPLSMSRAHLLFLCSLVAAAAAAGALAVPAAEVDWARQLRHHHGASPANDAPAPSPAPFSAPELCRPGEPVPAPSSSPAGATTIPGPAAPAATAPAPSPEADGKSSGAAAAPPLMTWPAVLAGAAGVATTLIL